MAASGTACSEALAVSQECYLPSWHGRRGAARDAGAEHVLLLPHPQTHTGTILADRVTNKGGRPSELLRKKTKTVGADHRPRCTTPHGNTQRSACPDKLPASGSARLCACACACVVRRAAAKVFHSEDGRLFSSGFTALISSPNTGFHFSSESEPTSAMGYRYAVAAGRNPAPD